MFEDFSFPSPSSGRGDDKMMLDCDSATISPLTSRSPSPSVISRRPHPLSRPRSPYSRRPQPPTSMPSNYDAFQRRISVGTLTEKLNAHTLEHSSGRSATRSAYEPPPSPLSPLSFALSTSDSPSTRSASSGHTLLTPPGDYDDEGYSEPVNQAWLRSQSNGYPTSIPAQDLLSPEEAVLYRGDCQRSVRRQRQHLSRAQCHGSGVDAVRLALLAEESHRRSLDAGDDECHPSSLPLEVSPNRRRPSALDRTSAKSRQVSSGSGIRSVSRERSPPDSDIRCRSLSSASFSLSSRVGKHRPARDLLHKKSEQTLRRQSLVCAALTSMMCETLVSSSE
jgi:hypothetical protein